MPTEPPARSVASVSVVLAIRVVCSTAELVLLLLECSATVLRRLCRWLGVLGKGRTPFPPTHTRAPIGDAVVRPQRDRVTPKWRKRAQPTRTVRWPGVEPMVVRFYRTDRGVAVQLTGLFSGIARAGHFWDWYSLGDMRGLLLEDYLLGFYRQPTTDNSTTPPTSAGEDRGLAAECPALHEYMTLTTLPDGQQRRPSTLLLFFEDGAVKACLSERDAGMSLWGTGDSVADVLAVLDALLRSEKPPWRKNKQQAAPKGKGR